MSILDLNLDDVADLTQIEDGEHEFEILSAELKSNKKGDREYVNVRLIATDGDKDVEDIYHMMCLPNKQDDSRKAANFLRRLKAFCQSFGIDTGASIDTDEWVGLVGRGMTKVKPSEDEFGDKVIVTKWLPSR